MMMMNNASLRLVQSSYKMPFSLAARSLGSRSVSMRTFVAQRSSSCSNLLVKPMSHLAMQNSVRKSLFSTSAVTLEDSVGYPKAEAEQGVQDLNSSTKKETKQAAPITSDYASLKPYIKFDTWKALTGSPFKFSQMSEVQHRVLSLLPDLADPSNSKPMPDNQGGRDLLVKAKTGTGKTIAFLTPALERRIRASELALQGQFSGPFASMLAKKKPELSDSAELDKHQRSQVQRFFNINTAGVLVLSPTRELATQIATEAEKLTKHHKDFGIQLLVGGASRVHQLRQWSRSRPDIVVATPGRLLDLLNEEPMVSNALSAVQTLIYDEADTLLDMGFRDDLERILRFLPKKEDRCTMLFSATVSSSIRDVARKSLSTDHRFIDCVPAGESNVHEHIPQFASVVRDGKEQMEQLTRLIAIDQIRNAGRSKIVVFAPTTKMVELYANMFRNRKGLLDALPAGINTSLYELHSRKDSSQRFRISSQFRNDKSGASILFTSDVSARGVDYPGTTRVINLGISGSTDQYIHRIGRTGRAGAQGRADIILQAFESGFLKVSLNKLPIKIEKVEDTKAQLATLCEDFDRDPESVVGAEVLREMKKPITNHKRSSRDRRVHSVPEKPMAAFFTPLSERLSDDSIKSKSGICKSENPQLGVEDVFMSNLGFYVGNAKSIGVDPNSIVDGLKEWAMSVADLEREPYVSQQMLTKMGVFSSSHKSSRFGRTSRFESPSNNRNKYSSGRFGRGGDDRGNRFGASGRGSGDRRNRFDADAYGGSSSYGRSDDRFF